jgi:hypothetical protein
VAAIDRVDHPPDGRAVNQDVSERVRRAILTSRYQRNDPQSAAGYFRSVGLHGPFWGLE